MKKLILVDGDIIANKASFAAETRWYSVGEERFQYKKDAKMYIKKHKLECKPVLQRDVLPVVLVYSMIDNLLRSILRRTEGRALRIYIGPPSGTKTFRHRAAVTAPYKGNRKVADRAIHLDAARKYLVDKHGARVTIDLEVDDVLGIVQCSREDTMIASIDKDLLQIPGWHYNLDSKEVLLSEDPGTLRLIARKSGKLDIKGTGIKWFMAQMLLGDPVDNIIKPRKGLGPKKVYSLLNGIEKPRKMWAKVLKIYKKEKVDIEENATLLWILRDKYSTYRDILGKIAKVS